MAKIAILCPGPSLSRLTKEQLGSPEVIIAVNSALDHPLAEGCDWWCAHDIWEPPLVLPKRVPRQGMVTCWAAIRDGQARHVPYPLVEFTTSRYAVPVRISTSAAVFWAAELLARMGGEGRIHMLGCEMEGTGHWEGTEDPLWTPDNWMLARKCLMRAVDAIPFPVWGIPWTI